MIDIDWLISKESKLRFSGYEKELLEDGSNIAGFNYEQAMLCRGYPLDSAIYILQAEGNNNKEKIENGLKIYKLKKQLELEDLLVLYPDAIEYIVKEIENGRLTLSGIIQNFRLKVSSNILVSTNFSEYHSFSSKIFTNKSLIEYAIKHPSFFEAITAYEFEYFIAELLEKMGYKNIEVTQKSKDHGVDIFAEIKHTLGTELMIVQCKKNSLNNRVGEPVIKQLLMNVKLQKASKGLIATTSILTKPAISLIDSYSHKLLSMDIETIKEHLQKTIFK